MFSVPARHTIRTAIQAAVGLAAGLPLIVQAAGIEHVAGVATVLAVSAGFARVMALPVVEQLLDRVGLGLTDAEVTGK
ncbi:hypothetical protein [Streptomyces sp. 8L]|uniref:hypothetical protein n=1 Tax=Streptomyces sp. 8L TaxID=2877242 RepID=UPI001CD61CF5|nr:hypothetical protein [Streptomyces sp. 8L]MCA1219880.1 hypothetical protein [Streptomyces sp. 8L]